MKKLKKKSDMSASKATGPNSIPTNLLKLFTDELTEPLVTILNKSLKEGIFPDILSLHQFVRFTKKAIGLIVLTIGQYRYFLTSAKYLKKQCITESNFSSPNSI